MQSIYSFQIHQIASILFGLACMVISVICSTETFETNIERRSPMNLDMSERGWGKRSFTLRNAGLSRQPGWIHRNTFDDKVFYNNLLKRRGWGKRGAVSTPQLFDDAPQVNTMLKRRGWGKRSIDGLSTDRDRSPAATKRRGWGKRSDNYFASASAQADKRRGWGKRAEIGVHALDDPYVMDALSDELEKRRGWGKRSGATSDYESTSRAAKIRGWGKRAGSDDMLLDSDLSLQQDSGNDGNVIESLNEDTKLNWQKLEDQGIIEETNPLQNERVCQRLTSDVYFHLYEAILVRLPFDFVMF